MNTELKRTSPGVAEPAVAGERLDGVVIGRLVRGGDTAEILVDYPGNPSGGPLAAVTTVESGADDVGRAVALAFQRGDPERPIVLGFIQRPGQVTRAAGEDSEGARVPLHAAVNASVDGERLVLTADREIVLKCGRASLTLTRAGKVLIRGKYLLSRSSGVNRIKGGSVQIN